MSTGDVRYLLLGQETLDKVPQRSSLLREEGEGPDSQCWESWLQIQVRRGLGVWSASPMVAGFGGTQGSALLPRIHHVDEWSHMKYPICQEPSVLAGVHRFSFSSRPSSVYLVPSA